MFQKFPCTFLGFARVLVLSSLAGACSPVDIPPAGGDVVDDPACDLDCQIFGCACAACPPPEGYGEIMCPGSGVAHMIADSAYCSSPPHPSCVLSDVRWTCPSGAVVRPWCCDWPDWSTGPSP